MILSALVIWCGSPRPAHALIDVPTFRFALGTSSLKFTAGSLYPTPTSLGSKFTLNPMFLWDISSARMRVGLHFLADVGSKFGSLPNSGIGASFLFYPLGLSSSREVSEDLSVVVKNRISPYVQFQFTPVKSAISDQVTSQAIKPNYFAALVLETALGLGLDYPVNEDLVTFLGLHYRFAAFTSQETTTGAIKYNGIELLGGVMTNFY